MDSALTLIQISRDPTPCMAEAALAMVNMVVGLYYWLPCDTPRFVILDGNYNTWGVTWQPVVQPHLDVNHRQGRLGRRGVGHPHQELQQVEERHEAVWASLVIRWALGCLKLLLRTVAARTRYHAT